MRLIRMTDGRSCVVWRSGWGREEEEEEALRSVRRMIGPPRRRVLAYFLVPSCFGLGGDCTFAYSNAGVAFNASFVAPGR